MKIALPPLELARWLLAAVMVAILVSPPLTSLLELLLYGLMLGSGDLRERLLRAVRHPLGATALAFWIVVGVGLAYGIAPWEEALATWFSWRRVLLLVFGLALFDDRLWKLKLAWILIAIATAIAIASYAAVPLDYGFRHYPAGVILRAPPLQGMLFSVAAFVAMLLLRYSVTSLRVRVLLATSAALLVLNAVFVTPGRSGYAVLVVLGVALALDWIRHRGLTQFERFGWIAGAAALALALLASSPLVRERIKLGLDEIGTYQQGSAVSSMGERVVYMRNALTLISDRPLIGHGTGSFPTAYARLVEGRSGREGLRIHDPHNQYLNIAAQHGLIGLAVFLAILVIAFRTRPASVYGYLGLSVLAAWCVTSLFSSHFSTFAEGRFIWLWLGVCLARD